jgi:hypothetical protein
MVGIPSDVPAGAAEAACGAEAATIGSTRVGRAAPFTFAELRLVLEPTATGAVEGIVTTGSLAPAVFMETLTGRLMAVTGFAGTTVTDCACEAVVGESGMLRSIALPAKALVVSVAKAATSNVFFIDKLRLFSGIARRFNSFRARFR